MPLLRTCCALLALTLLSACQSTDAPGASAPSEHPAGIIELAITSHGQRMGGHIYTAAGAGPHPTVVLLHGLPGNERNLDLAQHLRARGWNVLFFHYRGAWGSEGAYRFAHLAEDSVAVLDHLQRNASELGVDTRRVAFVGHSAGGFAAIRGATDPRVACVVGMAPADFGRYVAMGQAPRIAAYVDSLFMLAGTSGAIAVAELQDNGPAWVLGPVLARLDKPALVVTAEHDPVVTPEVPDVAHVQAVQLAGADHSFNGHRGELLALVTGFLEKDCPPRQLPARRTTSPM